MANLNPSAVHFHMYHPQLDVELSSVWPVNFAGQGQRYNRLGPIDAKMRNRILVGLVLSSLLATIHVLILGISELVLEYLGTFDTRKDDVNPGYPDRVDFLVHSAAGRSLDRPDALSLYPSRKCH
ncbi:lipid A export ATP-binding/permease protein MsbA [Striga asiatica]|uniref:Lipid A export ATP-binding/permease protein MsbA n=1 Tax=Striga asiatica TaxID=4170 RepID=A0A5A7RBV4_STRAF|nr:lipid A export ATP-binding/permease protein MsbA [Striga asiatica]